MLTNADNPLRFTAVGSTRGIVLGSSGRICGTIIGLVPYEQYQAIDVVGVFDLPENRTL